MVGAAVVGRRVGALVGRRLGLAVEGLGVGPFVGDPDGACVDNDGAILEKVGVPEVARDGAPVGAPMVSVLVSSSLAMVGASVSTSPTLSILIVDPSSSSVRKTLATSAPITPTRTRMKRSPP